MKAEEWLWIGQEIERRTALGLQSLAYLCDRPLPPDRVDRETSRHKPKARSTVPSNRESAIFNALFLTVY